MKAAGFCPMGCGQTLEFREEDGAINCAAHGCPDAEAVDKILREEETEHVVTFYGDSFSMQHPLRERIDGELHDCPLHRDLIALAEPPFNPGRYRAVRRTQPTDRRTILARWTFEALP